MICPRCGKIVSEAPYAKSHGLMYRTKVIVRKATHGIGMYWLAPQPRSPFSENVTHTGQIIYRSPADHDLDISGTDSPLFCKIYRE